MNRTAIFPGSFDPFTIGHESIVTRALDLFDEIIVAVGRNSTKANLYDLEKRVNWIKAVFAEEPRVKVESYAGITVTYAKQRNVRFILRGLRTASDFEFERAIAQVNKAMWSEIETVFILSLPEHGAISSTIIRDIIRNGGDAQAFVPTAIHL